MKSERRHELQRNTLEVEILKVWEFLKLRGNLLAWVGLGIAAVILGIVWYVRTSRSEAEGQQTQFERAVLPSGRGQTEEQRQATLEKIAADRSHPLWAANADVALGDTLSLRLASQWPNLSDGDRSAIRAQAEGYYNRAISDFPKETAAVAKARYGLGKLAESWGDVETARKEYEEVLAGEISLRGQPIRELVAEAMGRLNQFQGVVNMPASAPASGPSTQESQPASATAPASAPAASAPSAAPASLPARAPVVKPESAPAPSASPAATPAVQPATPAPAASTSAPADQPKSGPAKSD
jgi:hypothetical protein